MKILSLVAVTVLAIFHVTSAQRGGCSTDSDCPSHSCCLAMWRGGTCWSRRFGLCPNTASANSCINNMDCSHTQCCRVDFVGTMGKCEPHPLGHQSAAHRMTCPFNGPQHCYSQKDCASNECCRDMGNGRSECVHRSTEGKVCSRVTLGDLPFDHCPCDLGLDCKVGDSPLTINTGVCQSHMKAGCTSNRDCPGGCCKSFGGSAHVCVRSMDSYARCPPVQ